MFGLFGALALLIASVGMYSVMHYSVAQRLHEMGIRVALGAQRADIFRLVIAQTLAVVSIACIVGLSVVLLGGRLWADLLYRTSPRDPAVLAFATSLLLASGIAASLLPAWRATRVDPVTALRAD